MNFGLNFGLSKGMTFGMWGSTQKVNVVLDEDAYMPTRAYAYDAGADIRTPVAFTVPARGSHVVHTGIHIETPEGYATMIKSKSGLNVKKGIISEGVIDRGYDGEIVVKLYNLSDTAVRFQRGDKITQLVIVPVLCCQFVQASEIFSSERGSNGFGSTGA